MSKTKKFIAWIIEFLEIQNPKTINSLEIVYCDKKIILLDQLNIQYSDSYYPFKTKEEVKIELLTRLQNKEIINFQTFNSFFISKEKFWSDIQNTLNVKSILFISYLLCFYKFKKLCKSGK